jgi:hypothetical protein
VQTPPQKRAAKPSPRHEPTHEGAGAGHDGRGAVCAAAAPQHGGDAALRPQQGGGAAAAIHELARRPVAVQVACK